MSMRTKRSGDAKATYGDAAFPEAGLHFDESGNPFLNGPSGDMAAPLVYKLPIAGVSGSTGVFESLANPLGEDLLIVSAVLHIKTQSSGASTLDIGVGANATASNDGLFDGLSGATAGVFKPYASGGTNGKPGQAWPATGCLNVAEASGNVNALVAVLHVTCVRA